MKLNLAFGCAVAAVAIGVGGFRTLAEDAPAQSSAAPSARASLSGVWVKVGDPEGDADPDSPLYQRDEVMKTADGTAVPLKPWAEALVQKRLKDAAAGHPYASTQARCLPPGVPDMMFEFGPMQFLETPGQITILRQQFTFFRIIHMGGRRPKDPDPSYLGYSIGHWEGDALVVDTVGLNDKTGVRFVIPHSEDLHVVERIRLTPKGTMEIRATLDDPKTFTKSWTMVTELKRLNSNLTEYFCENNRNGVDVNGDETVLPPANH